MHGKKAAREAHQRNFFDTVSLQFPKNVDCLMRTEGFGGFVAAGDGCPSLSGGLISTQQHPWTSFAGAVAVTLSRLLSWPPTKAMRSLSCRLFSLQAAILCRTNPHGALLCCGLFHASAQDCPFFFCRTKQTSSLLRVPSTAQRPQLILYCMISNMQSWSECGQATVIFYLVIKQS